MVKYPQPQAKSKSHQNHSYLDQKIIRPDQAKLFYAFIPGKILQPSSINDNYSMETAVLHPERLGMNGGMIEKYMVGISR